MQSVGNLITSKRNTSPSQGTTWDDWCDYKRKMQPWTVDGIEIEVPQTPVLWLAKGTFSPPLSNVEVEKYLSQDVRRSHAHGKQTHTTLERGLEGKGLANKNAPRN